jgi:hypothetical protein
VISDTLDHVTQGELQRYENNFKALNLITNALGRNVYDRVAHLETAYDIWLKLCNTYEGSSEIKSSCRDTYNRQYQTFSQKPGELLNDCFARFESIVSSLHSSGPLAYSDNKRAKQLNLPKLTTHPTQSHPSTQREKQGKKLPNRERKLLCGCFVAALVTWMSFASGDRELRGGELSMLETHIVMSSLISRLILILMFRLFFTLVLSVTLLWLRPMFVPSWCSSPV